MFRRGLFSQRALLCALSSSRLSSSSVAVTEVKSEAVTATTPASSSTSTHKKKVVVATTLHAGEKPKTIEIDISTEEHSRSGSSSSSAAEKTFVTPKQMRDFTFSVMVGASTMAAIHYILSSSLAENYEDEVAVLRKVTRDTSEADKLPAKPEVPQFVAPSSYSALKKKMEEENRIARIKFLAAENQQETPVLHQELWQRAMFAWNNSLSSVEQSAAAMAVQYHEWRLRQMQKKVKAMIESQGLRLVEFKEV